MKRFSIGLLAVLCLAASVPGSALAQSPFESELGSLYLSFSDSSRVPTMDVSPFQSFSFYLVVDFTYADIGLPGEDIRNGMTAWEAYVSIDDAIIITQKTLNPPSSINVGGPPADSNDSNWIVGTGALIRGDFTPYVVVFYSGLLLTTGAQDLACSLGPSDPSSFDVPGGPGPVPGWLDTLGMAGCPDDCLRPFAEWQDRIVINCVNAPECGLAPEQIEIAAGHREGAPGSFIEVPVTVSRTEVIAAGDPSLLAGLDLNLTWDPAVATLADVTLAGATSEWLLQFNPGPGTVDISMAGLATIDVPAGGVDVVYLQFQLGGTAGQSALSFTDTRAFDLDQQPIDHTTSDGSVAVGQAPELIELAVGDGAGDPGAEVDVPFTVARLLAPAAGDPSQLAGIDLELQWDSAVATLVDVMLTPATIDWFMQYNATDGAVDISMASLATVDVPPSPLDMLTLRFRLESAAAATALEIVDSRAFDLDQQAIDHVTRNGSLTVDCEKGDVVPDGEVNSADAIRGLFFAVEMLTPTPSELCAADMNSDGLVEVGDVVQILQKAVGILVEVATTETPFLYARSGDAAGTMILHVENAAGADVVMTYDPALVDFVSASAPGSNGLTLGNDKVPGRLHLGFARATAFEGDIHLKFEIAEPHTTLRFVEATAFDELGGKQPFDMLSDEFIFGVTANDQAPHQGKTALLAAVPNPFNPTTQLRFVLSDRGDASLRIFDAAGRRVREFLLRDLPAGEHHVTWNGTDDDGQRVASGAYLVQLQANNTTDTGRVLMMK